jgi:hypothetical protein
MAIGSSEYLMSSIRCMRRSRISAVKKMHATLASSEGWIPRPPMPNQRRVPLIGLLNMTPTSNRPASPTSAQMKVSLR